MASTRAPILVSSALASADSFLIFCWPAPVKTALPALFTSELVMASAPSLELSMRSLLSLATLS